MQKHRSLSNREPETFLGDIRNKRFDKAFANLCIVCVDYFPNWLKQSRKMASARVRRQNFTVAKSLDILHKLEKGATVVQVAAEYGVHRKTIYRIRNKAASIRKVSKNPNLMDLKRTPILQYEDVDNQLYAWILKRRALGVMLTDNLLQEKARELQKEFAGSSNFTASRGWLWRFKRRHGIIMSNHKEKLDANQLAVDKFIEELWGILIDERIHEEDVYNMDETSLMWKAVPRRTLVQEERQLEGTKLRKDRVTVAFCANTTGTHKLPLLFVNKYANPRALKHCKHILPVVYKSENNGVVSKAIFSDWYTNNFKPGVRQYQLQQHRTGKVLLLVDNCRAHTISEQSRDDSQFKLMILPPNTSSTIQPMDQGVIAKCKKFFRHKLLRRIHQHSSNGVAQFYADYDVKDCIDIIAEAWNVLTTTNIRNSWRKLLRRPLFIESPEIKNFNVDFEEIDSKQLGETIPSEEIAEWISECEQAESTATEEEEIATQSHCRIEEEEIDRTFNNLAAWVESEPEAIKVHAQFLIDYYNLK